MQHKYPLNIIMTAGICINIFYLDFILTYYIQNAV